MVHHKGFHLLVGFAIGAVALVGCGSDDSTSSSSTTAKVDPSTSVTGSSSEPVTDTSAPSSAPASSASSASVAESAAVVPQGEPITLMLETSLTGPLSNYPGVVASVQAAALAVNQNGGIKDPQGGESRPLKIEVCDDKNDPNAAAECGRRAVDEKVLAMVGNESLVGDSYMPIVSAAGIPSIANFPISKSELTDPLSFPVTNPQVVSLAPATAAKSAGAKSAHIVLLDTPATTAFLSTAKDHITTTLGMEYKGETLIPPTATDYAPYAAKAVSSGADAIHLGMNGAQADKMIRAMIDQGLDLKSTIVVQPADFLQPALIDALDGAADGLYLIGTTWPATYTDNKGVAQYNAELDAFGNTTDPRNGIALAAWVGVHAVADILQGLPEITSAALIDALKSAGPLSYEPLAPFDWSTNKITSGPLANVHVHSDQVIVSRLVGGVLVPVVSGFVPFDKPFEMTEAG